jgi:putative transposase
MPRRPRIVLPGTPLHIIQRGNNRQACFYSDSDYQVYLEWLEEYSNKYECQIHAYVLMTNHVHLLLTPAKTESVGMMMKQLGQRYVQYINRSYRRTGTLWEGRFKSCIAQDEIYVLGCYRYIELNPVRADMVPHPAEYRWSSYRVNAQSEKSCLITPHQQYIDLASDCERRAEAYRDLFRYYLDTGLVDEIRKATNGNYALGSELFKDEVAMMLGRRVSPGLSGRPSQK